MEVAGETLGLNLDQGIWAYLRRHGAHSFPQLGLRANFSKLAAVLWTVKLRPQRCLLVQQQAFYDALYIVD
jgi:hypothetical protein